MGQQEHHDHVHNCVILHYRAELGLFLGKSKGRWCGRCYRLDADQDTPGARPAFLAIYAKETNRMEPLFGFVLPASRFQIAMCCSCPEQTARQLNSLVIGQRVPWGEPDSLRPPFDG